MLMLYVCKLMNDNIFYYTHRKFHHQVIEGYGIGVAAASPSASRFAKRDFGWEKLHLLCILLCQQRDDPFRFLFIKLVDKLFKHFDIKFLISEGKTILFAEFQGCSSTAALFISYGVSFSEKVELFALPELYRLPFFSQKPLS